MSSMSAESDPCSLVTVMVYLAVSLRAASRQMIVDTYSALATFMFSPSDYKVQRTHPFNGPLSRTTRVSRYQKGKTSVDFTEARDSERQWHQLHHTTKVCTSLQTDNHASTPPLSFFTGRMPFLPPNRVKAMKAKRYYKVQSSSISVCLSLEESGFLSSRFSVAHCLASAPLKSRPYGTMMIIIFYPRYYMIPREDKN